jgi:hypothetical protein
MQLWDEIKMETPEIWKELEENRMEMEEKLIEAPPLLCRPLLNIISQLDPKDVSLHPIISRDLGSVQVQVEAFEAEVEREVKALSNAAIYSADPNYKAIAQIRQRSA